ncbi:MAG: HincII family type II restriction endonuclease [Gammaproteobacteria bacterium]|nr:HincII family type II restriction endonuclease [Gammaproteobacteria bacterium]
MNINIGFLEEQLIHATVPRPVSGTLSGHAAGEPFDKHVYQLIKDQYVGKTFRQYELLNQLYLKNPAATLVEDRWNLIKFPALAFLLNRGKRATREWSPENLFAEKQNDTADVIVIEEGFFSLIDVKTFNLALSGQPPNIISSYKLAQMCGLMLESSIFTSHEITYVGVAWNIEGENLECVQASIKELLKADPGNLYINWAAAMQIQFHVEELDQSYTGSPASWCRDYLQKYVVGVRKRMRKMEQKFAEPFERYLE